MADQLPYPDANADDHPGSGRGSTSGMPRWLKVLGIFLVGALFVLFVIMHLAGHSLRGLHTSSGGAGGQPAPTAQGVHQP